MADLHLSAGACGQHHFLGEYDVFRGVTSDCPLPLPHRDGIPHDGEPLGLPAASSSRNLSSSTDNFYVRKVNKHQLTPRAILMLPESSRQSAR